MANKELLKNCCIEMNISISENQLNKFIKYMELLLEWNEKMNLTAITEEKEVVLKHFADCLSLVPYLDIKEDTKIIDVGTGAGFPGIPVKIMYPNTSMTLLDSLQKRIGFLYEVIKAIDLTNIECVHSRAEDGGVNPLYREQYDYCVSRAVANLSVLLEYSMPFIKVGGILAALKGPEIAEEVISAKKALDILGGEVLDIVDVKIPFTDLSHKLIFIKKIKNTPENYPRKAGKISKSPLK